MKKIYFVIILLLIMLPIKINAYEEGISKYYIDMTVKENGNLYVKELIILNGDFNGFERIINYKNKRLSIFDGSLNSFRGSDIYNGSGIKLISIKNIDVNSNSNFDVLYNSGDVFKEVSSASKGDYGKYVRTVTSVGEKYLIYNPDKGSEKGFYLEYELINMSVVHKDIGEVAINLFDELTEYVEVLEMKINIPNNVNLLRGWAHGPLTGEITLVNKNLIEVRATKINPNNPIDVRFAFDKNVIKDSNKFSNVSALDKIVEIETELANDANEKRQQVKLQLENEAKSAVMLAKSKPTRDNYNYALKSVNYLSNGELKQNLLLELEQVLQTVEKKENFYKMVICSVFVIWFGGLTVLVYYVYKKYDKEYDPEFKGHYYREIPANYGPEVLAYLLNKKIEPNDLSASIMNLINKKVITVEKNLGSKKEDYLLKKEGSDVNAAEQNVLDLVFDTQNSILLSDFKKKAKKSYESFLSRYDDWKLQAIAISRAEDFYETNNKKNLAIIYSIIGLVLTFVLYKKYINFLIYIIVFLLGIGSLIYFVSITKRSKKGNNDYSKWMGLKRFLKDFSLMDEKSLPEVALWEKYLVYAMPLGCAKKLSKDMKLKIQEMGVYDQNTIDSYDIDHMLRINRIVNSTMVSSVQAAHNEQARERMSEISSSSSSSGGGFGGGFSSGGGSFGGGGGGGRF